MTGIEHSDGTVGGQKARARVDGCDCEMHRDRCQLESWVLVESPKGGKIE